MFRRMASPGTLDQISYDHGVPLSGCAAHQAEHSCLCLGLLGFLIRDPWSFGFGILWVHAIKHTGFNVNICENIKEGLGDYIPVTLGSLPGSQTATYKC